MTKTIAESHRDAWLAADLAVANGQSYSIGEMTLTRADVATIRENISYWQRVVDTFAARANGNSDTDGSFRVAKF